MILFGGFRSANSDRSQMKLSVSNSLLLIGLAALSATSRAQDSDLGGLPPLPDLDMGDPQRKLSWREKRERTRRIEESRYEENSYRRAEADAGRATLGERVSTMAQKRKTAVPQKITVENSLPTSEDGITASGSRLRAFGDDNYWGELPPPTPEETLIDLPPMPDLRTPDQVTRKERVRDILVAKQERRKAEAEALREEKEMRERATVNRPTADPSTALVLVESQGQMGSGFIGNQEAPQTVDEGTLKPFNENSTFYKDNQMLYKGDRPTAKPAVWWKRGTNEQGGPVEAKPKWEWRNPFAAANDEVQPVSFGLPDSGGGHSSGGASRDGTSLTSNLQGIRVVPTTRDVVKKGSPGSFSGVVTEGVELPTKVYNVLSSRVGQPLTLGGLNQMVREAVLAYRRSDLPVVDVLVPEQEITSGILQLVIIEGRLGDVIVENAGDAESRALARQIRTERGEVIRESRLTDDLNWINKHPNRQVDLVFSPGGGYGETDVILRNQTARELTGYLSLDNSGNSALGESRAVLGASWTGPLFFGMDSVLSYQFTTNIDSGSTLYGHSGVFASYLPWRHQLTVLGAHVYTDSNVGVGNALFNSGGENKQTSFRYGIPLPGTRSLSHEFELGMDFKSNGSALLFNQVQVFDSTAEIVQYNLGYNIVARDSTGAWRVDAEVVNSPGNNTNKNTDAIFQTQRAGATAAYTYGLVTVERDQQLPKGWSAYGRVQGQASNSNLLATEAIGAGGFDSVRGWEQRALVGDNGIVLTAEVRTPLWYPSTFLGFGNVQDGAYGLVFFDYGSLSSEVPLPGEPDYEIGSVGMGVRYQRDNWFSMRVDYGFQVIEEGFEDGNQGRWEIGATVTF